MPGSKGLPHPPPGCSHSCPHRCPARRKESRRAQSGQGDVEPISVFCPGPQRAEGPIFSCTSLHGPTPTTSCWQPPRPRAGGASLGLFIWFVLVPRTPALCSRAGQGRADTSPQPQPLVHSQNAQAAPSPPASASAPSAPRPAGSRQGRRKHSEAERDRKVCEPPWGQPATPTSQ